MLPKTGYPFALIHIHIDPAEIDVNVHPAKTEIKFSDEQRMYRALYHSIITALMEQENRKTLLQGLAFPGRRILGVGHRKTRYGPALLFMKRNLT